MLSTLLSTPTLVTLTSIVNFSVAFLAFAIGALVLWRDKRSPINQLFFLVAFNTGFWTFSSTMADVIHTDSGALFWAQMAIIGPFFLSAGFLVLSYYFPQKVANLSLPKAALIFLPSIIALFLVPTKVNVESVRLEYWGTDFTPGPLYAALFLHLLLYFGLAARNLYKTWKKTDSPITKKQIVFLYTGMALVVSSGIVTNLVLPLVFNYTRASVIGPAATLFFVVLTMYAIVKHGLLNLKVIATEVFASSFVFFNFIQIFRSPSTYDLAINSCIFVATAAVAALLVKSVLDEVRRSEELHALSEMLAAANEDLKQMDQLKSEFISIASHQLRTPISVIKGYLSLILEGAYGALDGAMKDKMEQMYSMNERLVQMVNNMLNVTRIEKNKLEYVCAMVDVRLVIDQAVEEMAIKARQRRVEVAFVGRPEKPIEAFVDQEKLHEVLTNLIDNAIKYSEGGTIEVSARAASRRRGIMITVKDEGIGMTSDEARQVFQKFYRAREPGVLRESGTGLGLYICAMFTRSMGGDIWIDRTAPGKGTTFALVVPSRAGGECVPRPGKAKS